MVEVIQEKGIDMDFKTTTGLEAAIAQNPPEMIVTMGCGEKCPFVPGCRMIDRDLPDPSGQSKEFMHTVRNDIENRVHQFISEVTES